MTVHFMSSVSKVAASIMKDVWMFADIIKTLGSAGGELACFSTGAQGTQPTRHRALKQLDTVLL